MPKREEFRPEELHGGKDWFDDEKKPESAFKTVEDVVDPESGEDAFIDSLDMKIANEKQDAEEERRRKEKEGWLKEQEMAEMEERRQEVLKSFSKPKTKTPEETYRKEPFRKQEEGLIASGKRRKSQYPVTTRQRIEMFKVAARPKPYPIDKENFKTMPEKKKQRNFRDRIANFLGLQKEQDTQKYDSEQFLDDHQNAA